MHLHAKQEQCSVHHFKFRPVICKFHEAPSLNWLFETKLLSFLFLLLIIELSHSLLIKYFFFTESDFLSVFPLEVLSANLENRFKTVCVYLDFPIFYCFLENLIHL